MGEGTLCFSALKLDSVGLDRKNIREKFTELVAFSSCRENEQLERTCGNGHPASPDDLYPLCSIGP